VLLTYLSGSILKTSTASYQSAINQLTRFMGYFFQIGP
jgi:hypothetical protein